MDPLAEALAGPEPMHAIREHIRKVADSPEEVVNVRPFPIICTASARLILALMAECCMSSSDACCRHYIRATPPAGASLLFLSDLKRSY